MARREEGNGHPFRGRLEARCALRQQGSAAYRAGAFGAILNRGIDGDPSAVGQVGKYRGCRLSTPGAMRAFRLVGALQAMSRRWPACVTDHGALTTGNPGEVVARRPCWAHLP